MHLRPHTVPGLLSVMARTLFARAFASVLLVFAIYSSTAGAVSPRFGLTIVTHGYMRDPDAGISKMATFHGGGNCRGQRSYTGLQTHRNARPGWESNVP